MRVQATPGSRPVVLVGGYWIGPWAWQEVQERLASRGHPVVVPTLPGLGDGTPPETVTAVDQARTILESLRALVDPMLVVHSGAGAVASVVTDLDPGAAARVVYVDSGPVAAGQVPRPDLAGLQPVPVPTVAELRAMGALTADLTDDQLTELATKGLPQPPLVANAPIALSNPLRLAVPSTVVCCGFGSSLVQELARSGQPMFAPLLELERVDYLDLPAGHWPMWSRPEALADCLHEIAGTG